MTLEYLISAYFISIPFVIFPVLIIKGIYQIIKKLK
jgi:hypothetical protein